MQIILSKSDFAKSFRCFLYALGITAIMIAISCGIEWWMGGSAVKASFAEGHYYLGTDASPTALEVSKPAWMFNAIVCYTAFLLPWLLFGGLLGFLVRIVIPMLLFPKCVRWIPDPEAEVAAAMQRRAEKLSWLKERK